VQRLVKGGTVEEKRASVAATERRYFLHGDTFVFGGERRT
jgi:hypothetical protein